MREAIDLLPQPILNISHLDIQKGLSGQAGDTKSVKSKTSSGWQKVKKRLTLTKNFSKLSKQNTKQFGSTFRKMSGINNDDDERERDSLVEDDHTSVRSSVNKSLRK